jgi:alkylation response protein AidB-like acyl-CoA dehydrogenase
MLFVNAGVTSNQTETIADVTTGEFVRVMVTNSLSPMRVIESLEQYVPATGLIGVMSSGLGVSMLKIHQSELCQRITDLMLENAGENAGLLQPMEGNRQTHPAGQFIEARRCTIYGGSSEIQRNILAKNVARPAGLRPCW